MNKTIISVIAIIGTFASVPIATAQNTASPPSATQSPSPGMGMMRGMGDRMGMMEKRMGGMRQMMASCTADKPCPTDKMMTDMGEMHSQMEKMMGEMKSMPKGADPKSDSGTAPKTTEKHDEHR